MKNDIVTYEDKKIVLMKSGLIHWVTEATGEKMSNHMANQSGHSFIRVIELDNITINTAEVEGIYNHQQYTDLCRVKSGEWQCSYGKWHNKKAECKCKEDKYLEDQKRKQQEKEAEEDADMTPEEKAKNADAFIRLTEMAALDGPGMFRDMFTRKKDPKIMRKSTVDLWEERNHKKADTAWIPNYK